MIKINSEGNCTILGPIVLTAVCFAVASINCFSFGQVATLPSALRYTKMHSEFCEIPDAELRKLIRSDSNCAAIYAAWERAFRAAHFGDDVDTHSEIQRFMGLVEGRLQICLPDFFAKRISFVTFAIDGQDGLGKIRIRPPIFEMQREPYFSPANEGLAVTITDGFQLARKNDKWGVVGNSLDLLIPGFDGNKMLVDGSDEEFHCSRIIVYEGDTYILIAAMGSQHKFPLLCIEKLGGLRWTSIIRAVSPEPQGVLFSGWYPLTAEIVVRENKIHVFAVTDTLFFEQVSLETGSELCRFSLLEWDK